MYRLAYALAALAVLFGGAASAQPIQPQYALETLLAADRFFSRQASGAADPVAGLAPMLDAEVALAVSGRQFTGRDAVLAAMRGSASYQQGGISWTPIRGGISADGTQGFTFGFMTVDGGEEARRKRQYLSYWILRPEGWRVVSHRQIFREPGEISTKMLPPSLPGFSAAPTNDPAVIAAHGRSLAAAEKAFSDLAQTAGRPTAFRENTREDGMLMGGGTGFTLGRDAVAAVFPKDEKASPLRWSTDRYVVPSSGDLGLSIGTLHFNAPKEGQPESIPFFTIWRRDSPDAPWRLIAE